MNYLGSCLCQKVKYRFKGQFDDFYLCHCRFCQKDTGSAHAANLFSRSGELEWIMGEDYVHIYQLPESHHQKSFCVNCGSALPRTQSDINIIVVPAGSLDSELKMRPGGHLFFSRRANWDISLEKIRKFDRLPYDTEG